MKYNKKVSFLQRGNRLGTTAGKSNAEIMAEARRNQASGPAATSRPSNAEIMAEARRHQAREQGQQAQDAQAALAQQNRGNAIASNRIQGNVPSVSATSSFRIPTTQDMRAHANPVRRTGGIPLRNRAVAATNVFTPEGGWRDATRTLPVADNGYYFKNPGSGRPSGLSRSQEREIEGRVNAERIAARNAAAERNAPYVRGLNPGTSTPYVNPNTRPVRRSQEEINRSIYPSFQQGGTMKQGVSQEDLIMDFAIRYLTTMGVAEQDIMDQDGNVNPEYVEEITAAINEVDNPEFWEAYEQAPDELVMEYIESSNPGAVEMARKGAKLRVLNSLKYKTYR